MLYINSTLGNFTILWISFIGTHLIQNLLCPFEQIAKRREKILNYMLLLRITPTLPNTFINMASPIVDIPFHVFFLATLVGLMPASYITVKLSVLSLPHFLSTYSWFISYVGFCILISIHIISLSFLFASNGKVHFMTTFYLNYQIVMVWVEEKEGLWALNEGLGIGNLITNIFITYDSNAYKMNTYVLD